MMTHALTNAEIFRVLIGFGFVLFLLVFLSFLLKKTSKLQNKLDNGIQLLTTFRIGTKEKLTVVKVGGRYLLLGSGAGQVNLLYDFGECLPQGFKEQNALSFSSLLQSWTVK